MVRQGIDLDFKEVCCSKIDFLSGGFASALRGVGILFFVFFSFGFSWICLRIGVDIVLSVLRRAGWAWML